MKLILPHSSLPVCFSLPSFLPSVSVDGRTSPKYCLSVSAADRFDTMGRAREALAFILQSVSVSDKNSRVKCPSLSNAAACGRHTRSFRFTSKLYYTAAPNMLLLPAAVRLSLLSSPIFSKWGNSAFISKVLQLFLRQCPHAACTTLVHVLCSAPPK